MSGDTIYGLPSTKDGSILEINGKKGWYLVTGGPGKYDFDLYTGDNDRIFVGTAVLSIGDCSMDGDNSSTILWTMSGSNGVCYTRDNDKVDAQVSKAVPANGKDLESSSCCTKGGHCMVGVVSAIQGAHCGNCEQ
jgi:hypothetical protein